MVRRATIVVISILFCAGNAKPEKFVLVRDPNVKAAQTVLGSLPVVVQPVSPNQDIAVVVLSETLTVSDLSRVQGEMSMAFSSSFLSAHAVRLLELSGGGVRSSTEPVTATAGIATALKHFTPAAGAAFSLTDLYLQLASQAASSGAGNWSQVVLVGRFPADAPDERISAAWLSAWIGDCYRQRRLRVSFWALDGAIPGWAHDLSQSTAGAAADKLSALLPALNNADALFQASWQMNLKAGSWPYLVTLSNKAGERVASLGSLAGAEGFAPPIGSYIAARALQARSPADDEEPAQRVLAINPADADALAALGKLYRQRGKTKEAADVWRRLSEINPTDGSVWAELGFAAFHLEAFDEADNALTKAAALGVKGRSLSEARARILLRSNQYSNALPLIDEALRSAPEPERNDQALLLLRADCAHGLKRWPLEAESTERALKLGPAPLERMTLLIEGYLAAGQTAPALSHLRAVTKDLPKDAETQCRYAALWEQAHEDGSAETLWRNAIAVNTTFEAAYIGLAANQLRAHGTVEVLKVAEQGLAALPNSYPLLLAKERALEAAGDMYAARRLLNEHAAGLKDANMLERRSMVEDWYGAAGPEAYAALLNTLTAANAADARINEAARRGLTVSIRDENQPQAQMFARKLADKGDRSGLDLLQPRGAAALTETELPGGADALHFLLFGGGKAKPERIFTDECRSLISIAEEGGSNGGKTAWQVRVQTMHEYFQRVAALAALGERKAGRVEIALTLATKPGKQRTEKVFTILGLKLKHGKEGIAIESAEGRGQTKKQDTLAALAIDDQAIQESLAAGKTYILELPMDKAPVFPSEDLWRRAISGYEKYPGGLAEALVADVRLPRIYLALNSMDRGAAQSLLQSMSLWALAERYSVSLSVYSSALAIRAGHAEVPGGRNAEGVWQALAGSSPGRPAAFFQSLMGVDEGRLMAYFYTLSQLDLLHQKFFTRSPERAQRFYGLFREAPEMKRGSETKLGNASFVDFLRNVPLNEDGTVDFPGSPEVWMVAKGHNTASVGKMTRKLKKAAAPDDEDEILIRLAKTGYKAQSRDVSELANFIAVTQIDEQRDDPLDVNAALLLAQGYGEYRGLFPYFADLGNLESGDYQAAFSFQAKLTGTNAALLNLRAGEFHSVLAMLGLLRESGLVPAAKILATYRTCLARYLAANDGAAWTQASLSAADDLSRLAVNGTGSRDKAIRSLLIGDAGLRREKSFEQVLALQKVPSIDGLCAIRAALKRVNEDPRALNEIQRQMAAFTVVPISKTWKVTGERKKSLELFDTASAQGVVMKLHEKLARKKRNPADIEKLSGQLLAELEPWAQLALTGRIYARFLDPSDMLVSEDAMLLRKHEFISLEVRTSALEYFPAPALLISSEGSGSRFVGSLWAFSLVAGEARAAGNHIGTAANPAFSKALLGSVRATDWRALDPAKLMAFSATVRLAREWIVASAASDQMLQVLEEQTRGILSLNRRNTLLDGLERRNWPAVWRSVSISDLHFLGDGIIAHAPTQLWNTPALQAMKAAATHAGELDLLGQVAPDLNGCSQPRLHRYEPYEEYQRNFMPARLAERLAELKLYLAWMSDGSAWPTAMLPDISNVAADQVLKRLQMHDRSDWEAVLEAFRGLKPEELEMLRQP